MADSNTLKLGLTKPEIGASSDTWGDKLNEDMNMIDAALVSHHFAENAAGHSGLNFAFKSGVFRDGINFQSVNSGIVLLTDASTNYIELDPSDATVKANTTGFTIGRIPLFTVVTSGGSITTVTDCRAFLIKAVPVNKQWFLAFGGEGSENTTSYLTKGAVYEPPNNLKCYGFGMLNSDLNTQALKLRLFELNGTTQVGTALAESSSITGAGEQTFLSFEFQAPVTLLSGKRYVIAISNTTSGATAVKAATLASPTSKLTGFKRNTYVYINNANPAAGATWTLANSSPYTSGIKIQID